MAHLLSDSCLHAFGYLDAQQTHAQTDYLAYLTRQGETEHLDIGIFFAKNAEVVVELVVFLYQVVAVVSNHRRTLVFGGLV